MSTSEDEAARERFLVFDKGDYIWIADADGRDPRRLVRGAYAFVSPDGHRIAYGARDGIHVISAEGEDDRFVAEGRVEDWLPDSRRLLAHGDGLVVIDDETGEHETVVPRLASARLYGLDLSSDGKWVVYSLAERLTRWGILRDRMDIYVAPVIGGAPRRITKNRLSAWPIWSGNQLLFSRLPRDNRLAPGIWRINRDGSEAQPVVARAPARYSRNGFYGFRPYFARDGGPTIIGIRTEWGDRAALLRPDGSLQELGVHLGHVSRNGRWVLGVQGGAEFPFTVKIVRVSDGHTRTVASGEITWEHWNR